MTDNSKRLIITIFAVLFGVFAVLSVVVPFATVLFLGLLLRGEDTVLAEIKSPDGTQMARLISRNEGAMGGSTIVVAGRINAFTGKLVKPSEIYRGRWAEEVEIAWKDDYTLLINGEEYPVNNENSPARASFFINLSYPCLAFSTALSASVRLCSSSATASTPDSGTSFELTSR